MDTKLFTPGKPLVPGKISHGVANGDAYIGWYCDAGAVFDELTVV